MLVTWLEIALTDSAVRTGATMPLLVPQVVHRLGVLAEVMLWIENTNNSCKNFLAEHLPQVKPLSVSKLDQVVTTMVATTMAAALVAIPSHGNADQPALQLLGSVVETTEDVAMATQPMVVLHLHGLEADVGATATATAANQVHTALLLDLQAAPHHGNNKLHHPLREALKRMADMAVILVEVMATLTQAIHLSREWVLLLDSLLVVLVLLQVSALCSSSIMAMEPRELLHRHHRLETLHLPHQVIYLLHLLQEPECHLRIRVT